MLEHSRFTPKPEHLCMQRWRLACAQCRVGVAGKGKKRTLPFVTFSYWYLRLKELRAWSPMQACGQDSRGAVQGAHNGAPVRGQREGWARTRPGRTPW